MAFGSSSKIFSAFVHDSTTKTGNASLSSATVKAALYNDTITPNQLVTAANSAYGGGVWAAGSGGNVQDASGWPYVGRPLAWGSATKLTTYADATLKYDADDTVSANATTSVTCYGCLVYDDAATTATDQAFCYISFGGSAQTVSSGTFTIVWNSSGILTIAL